MNKLAAKKFAAQLSVVRTGLVAATALSMGAAQSAMAATVSSHVSQAVGSSHQALAVFFLADLPESPTFALLAMGALFVMGLTFVRNRMDRRSQAVCEMNRES